MQPSRSKVQHIGLEGALMTLAPSPFILACAMSGGMPLWWQLSAAAVAAVAILLTAFFLFRRNLSGKILGGVAIAACVVTALPYLASSPFAALIGFVAAVSAGFFLKDFRVRADEEQRTTHTYRCLQRVRWASLTTPLLVGLALFVCPAGHVLTDWAIATAIVINLILFCHWLWNQHSRTRVVLLSMVNLLALGGIVIALEADYIHELATLLSILIFVFLPKSTHVFKTSKHWWEPLLDHPARVLFSTFLGLCILGTLLLQIPAATRINTISLVDAAFTSVSAVCVTGLIVLDTPKDFSLFGQILILLFIQLGGLGTMTISTVAFMACSIFVAGMIFVRCISHRMIRPLEEIHNVIIAQRNGETLRRCTGVDLPHEIQKIFIGINEILDKCQKQCSPVRLWPAREEP